MATRVKGGYKNRITEERDTNKMLRDKLSWQKSSIHIYINVALIGSIVNGLTSGYDSEGVLRGAIGVWLIFYFSYILSNKFKKWDK